MANSFLPAALETGNLTVQTDCEAIAFDGNRTRSGFRATALHVVSRDAATGGPISRFAIKARFFVVACGAIHSAALLLRTRGFTSRPNAQKVWLQPHAAIHALFDEPVTHGSTGKTESQLPFNGVPAIYNFTGMLRDRGYCWFSSVQHPASLATCTAHLAPADHLALLSRFHYTASLTITMRDNPDRSRIVMRGDRPQLDFVESASDRERLRRCFLDASRALLAVGARKVFLPMLQPPGLSAIPICARLNGSTCRMTACFSIRIT
jgi:hypothetical protein